MKRLVRKEGKILGVCEGLGAHFNIDPTILRIIFVIAVVFYGTGIVLYLLLALLMPKE